MGKPDLNREIGAAVAKMIDDGFIRPLIGERFPLEQRGRGAEDARRAPRDRQGRARRAQPRLAHRLRFPPPRGRGTAAADPVGGRIDNARSPPENRVGMSVAAGQTAAPRRPPRARRSRPRAQQGPTPEEIQEPVLENLDRADHGADHRPAPADAAARRPAGVEQHAALARRRDLPPPVHPDVPGDHDRLPPAASPTVAFKTTRWMRGLLAVCGTMADRGTGDLVGRRPPQAPRLLRPPGGPAQPARRPRRRMARRPARPRPRARRLAVRPPAARRARTLRTGPDRRPRGLVRGPDLHLLVAAGAGDPVRPGLC